MRVLAILICLAVLLTVPASAEAAESLPADLVVYRFKVPMAAQAQAELALQGEVVYSCLRDGQVVAISADNGRIKWTYSGGSKIRGGIRPHGDFLLLGSEDGTVACIRAIDGAVIWKQAIPDCVTGLLETDGKYVFAAGRSGSVYAFLLESGKAVWTTVVNDFIDGGPLQVEGKVYICTTGGTKTGSQLHCFEAASGKLLFVTQLDGWSSRCMCSAYPVIVVATSGDREGAVWGIDARNGALLWKYRGDFDSHWSSLLADGQTIYAGCQGQVVALEATTGNQKWSWLGKPVARAVGRKRSTFYPNVVNICSGPEGHICITTYYDIASSGTLEILKASDGDQVSSISFKGRLAWGGEVDGQSLVLALDDHLLFYRMPSVIVDGMPLVDPTTPCRILGGKLYAPLRPILAAMGMEVAWDEANAAALGKRVDMTISVPSHGSYIMINGKREELTEETLTTDGRIMVPVRAFVKCLGGEIDWDGTHLQARVRFQ
ncbi:MAG TPA: PQQ-binding-like beta-propeller repeat protein [Firmicutes bacterium]|nr:PQQ-binding-like beta-propeller repeat protein [Bacillota bacterium]